MGWDAAAPGQPDRQAISIHPPRVGWDQSLIYIKATCIDFNPPTPCGVGLRDCCNLYISCQFQSTHPVWGGTVVDDVAFADPNISIHPPRVGWDGHGHKPVVLVGDFNPPTPCGVGPRFRHKTLLPLRFQSTHPVWGGTLLSTLGGFFMSISIHPPRVGWDLSSLMRYSTLTNFNPPTPCGVGQRRAS